MVCERGREEWGVWSVRTTDEMDVPTLLFSEYFVAGPPTVACALRLRLVCREWKATVDSERDFWLNVCRGMRYAAARSADAAPAHHLMRAALRRVPSASRCIECVGAATSRCTLLGGRVVTLCIACQLDDGGYRQLVTRRQVDAMSQAARGGWRVRWRAVKGRLRIARYSRKGAHFYWRAQADRVLRAHSTVGRATSV